MSTATDLRRLVDLNMVEWLAEPGEYVVRGGYRSDVARMRRIAKRHGRIVRSTWDAGRLLVDIR